MALILYQSLNVNLNCFAQGDQNLEIYGKDDHFLVAKKKRKFQPTIKLFPIIPIQNKRLKDQQVFYCSQKTM